MTNDKDPEELLSEGAQSRRTTTEAPTTDADTPDLQAAIKAAYDEIEAGDRPRHLQFRETDLAAIMAGLEASGDLAAVIETAAAQLDREADGDSRAAALKLLVRLGIEAVDDEIDVVATAQEAKQEHLLEQAGDI